MKVNDAQLGTIVWLLEAGPVEGDYHAHTVPRSWDMLATHLRILLPFNITTGEAMAMGEYVAIEFKMNGMAFLRVPIRYLPAAGGPYTGVEHHPYFSRQPLLIRQADRVEVRSTYDLRLWVYDEDRPDRLPPPPLSKRIEYHLIMDGETEPEGTK